MSSIFDWIRRLFGPRSLSDDHLDGAVDLSDSAYCLGLLASADE